jgi:hypothetical protein
MAFMRRINAAYSLVMHMNIIGILARVWGIVRGRGRDHSPIKKCGEKA